MEFSGGFNIANVEMQFCRFIAYFFNFKCLQCFKFMYIGVPCMEHHCMQECILVQCANVYISFNVHSTMHMVCSVCCVTARMHEWCA